MLSIFANKSLVVIAIVHFSVSVLADPVLHHDEGYGMIAPSVFGRRSFEMGKSTRLHRSRRRRSSELPKPFGTAGAATTDAENIRLLEKYVEHQSEVNTAWQKKANSDILQGKTAIQFDKFEDQYEGHPHRYSSFKDDNYGKQSSSDDDGDNYGKQHSSKEDNDNSNDQCEAENRKPAGERGPTLMDRAREKAKKKAAREAQHKDTKKKDKSENDDNYGASSNDKPQKKSNGKHQEEQNSKEKPKSQPAKSASESDAEKQQEEKQRQEKEDAKRKQKEEDEKKEEQEKEKTAQQEAEKQQKEAQRKKKEEEKQKEKEEKQKEKEEKQKQAPSSSSNGPLAQYLGQTFSGDMTYYDVGLDACGWTDKVEGHTVAVSPEWFDRFSGDDDNPNHNKICGKKIKIHKNGKTEFATITDECPPCTSGSIDMSQSLFESLENLDVGRCNVKWEFVNE